MIIPNDVARPCRHYSKTDIISMLCMSVRHENTIGNFHQTQIFHVGFGYKNTLTFQVLKLNLNSCLTTPFSDSMTRDQKHHLDCTLPVFLTSCNIYWNIPYSKSWITGFIFGTTFFSFFQSHLPKYFYMFPLNYRNWDPYSNNKQVRRYAGQTVTLVKDINSQS